MRRSKMRFSDANKENNECGVPNTTSRSTDNHPLGVLKSKHPNTLAEGVLQKNIFWSDKEHAIEHYENLEIVPSRIQTQVQKSNQQLNNEVSSQQPKYQFQQELETHHGQVEVIQHQVYQFQQSNDDSESEDCPNEQKNIQVQLQKQKVHRQNVSARSIYQQQEESSIMTSQDLINQIVQNNVVKDKGNSLPKNNLIVDDFGEDQCSNNQEEFKSQIETIKIIRQPPENLSIEDFVSQALPKGYVLQCCLRRDTSDVSSTTYSLYISNTFKHLLSARKKAFCATSNYALSTDKTDFDANSKSYMGKVRSNFLGTQFNGYSKGTNPDKATDQSTVRANIVTVNYQKNFFGSSGPRKMQIFLPKPLANSEVDYIKPPTQDKTLESEIYTSSVIKLINKPPEWDKKTGHYILNFNGRVTKASIKNFLIVDKATQKVHMLFGRIAKNVFSLDLQYPFSVLQAMSVVLSSFDKKLACE